ncbi:copper chaperone PCu(A)C [Chitinibacter sp. ZOR0017]|uniref:copper chaperone PCu(A)C n=1 Tax=Chitinibacter sp. ZOR0017 TaxID=1339254 RepID=UPI000647D641|nr:copper chaperone PCu(A)C [Chitinibacter sp. ZOR0017]
MHKKLRLGAALLCLSISALAHEYRAGELEIKHPWARETVATATTDGVFMVIHSAADDQLLSASTPIASKTELHEMRMNNGVMQMRQIETLPLPKGSVTKLIPGSFHLMLFGVQQPLKAGSRFPLTLNFAKAGSVKVDIKVEDAQYHVSPAEHQGH